MSELTIHRNTVGWGIPAVGRVFDRATGRSVHHIYAHANAEADFEAAADCELEIMPGLERGGADRAVYAIRIDDGPAREVSVGQWYRVLLRPGQQLRLSTQSIDIGQCWNFWYIAGAAAIKRGRRLRPFASTLVRECHYLELPDLYGFNGCVVPFEEGYLVVYRAPENALTACRLGPDYRPTGSSVRLNMDQHIDSRLIEWNGDLWVSSCFIPQDCTDLRKLDRKSLTVGTAMRFKTIAGWRNYQKGIEKNWSPWVHNDQLYYSHWPRPHRVLSVDVANRSVQLLSEHSWEAVEWRADIWGAEFRGNAQAVSLNDGTFLSTFHSLGRDGYCNGFYRFENHLPHRVVGVSREPYLTAHDTTGKPTVRGGCNFIVGMQVDGDLVRISGGDNDHSSVVYHLSLKEVLASLASV